MTTERYEGKAKCSCGRRASLRDNNPRPGQVKFACRNHAHLLPPLGEGMPPDDEHMSEADLQTWGRLFRGAGGTKP